MRELLIAANHDLGHQIATLQDLLGAAAVPPELAPYRSHIEQTCDELRLQVRRNLKDLDYNLPDTYPRILLQTQRIGRVFELVNSRFAGPALRSRPEDRIGLIVLRWLHDEHPKAAGQPFGISDGSFAIYPTGEWPAVYFLPCSRQRTLHYLPLLFHEFGHLLYVLHKRELDDLVADLQKTVGDLLAPKTVRQRSKAEQQDKFGQQAELAWYEWAQEFFCDAVGLTIGGPCFLKAFWNYFRCRSRDEFYMPRDKQITSRHPVTWLRIRTLIDRAKKLGLEPLATQVDSGWHDTASLLGVREDYEGMWTEEFFVPLRETLDHMLVESAPRQFTAADVSDDYVAGKPLTLLNAAWSQFESKPDHYKSWEKSAADEFTKSY